MRRLVPALVLAVAAAVGVPATAAPSPGLDVVGQGAVVLTLPAGTVGLRPVPTGGRWTVVHLQPLDEATGDGLTLAVLPGFAPGVTVTEGDEALPAGTYRLSVLSDKATTVTLSHSGLHSRVTVRARPSTDRAVMTAPERVDGADRAAHVVRQSLHLPARRVVFAAGFARYADDGLTSTRMGVCLTDPGAPCEQRARVAGRVTAGTAAGDEVVAAAFPDDTRHAEDRDAGAYFDAAPSLESVQGFFAVFPS